MSDDFETRWVDENGESFTLEAVGHNHRREAFATDVAACLNNNRDMRDAVQGLVHEYAVARERSEMAGTRLVSKRVVERVATLVHLDYGPSQFTTPDTAHDWTLESTSVARYDDKPVLVCVWSRC